MINALIVCIGCLIALGGFSIATWSIISANRIKREQKATIEREFDKYVGMSIGAATIDHILRNAPERTTAIESAAKISAVTSRWSEYNPTAYQEQKDKLSVLLQVSERLRG